MKIFTQIWESSSLTFKIEVFIKKNINCLLANTIYKKHNAKIDAEIRTAIFTDKANECVNLLERFV